MAKITIEDAASAVMTHKVISVLPGDTIQTIAAVLCKHAISAAPVVDAAGKLLGMVSERDLMRSFGAAHTLRRSWWLELLAEGENLAPDFLEYVRADKRIARDVMTKTLVTAHASDTIGEIADLLSQHKIKRVPILQDGKMVGIVSRADVVRVLAQTPQPTLQPA